MNHLGVVGAGGLAEARKNGATVQVHVRSWAGSLDEQPPSAHHSDSTAFPPTNLPPTEQNETPNRPAADLLTAMVVVADE
jgi:hypothetical protein